MSKIESHISFIEKDWNEFKFHSNKSVEEILTHRAVKTTIEIGYDKDLFDNCDNTDEVFKDFFVC